MRPQNSLIAHMEPHILNTHGKHVHIPMVPQPILIHLPILKMIKLIPRIPLMPKLTVHLEMRRRWGEGMDPWVTVQGDGEVYFSEDGAAGGDVYDWIDVGGVCEPDPVDVYLVSIVV